MKKKVIIWGVCPRGTDYVKVMSKNYEFKYFIDNSPLKQRIGFVQTSIGKIPVMKTDILLVDDDYDMLFIAVQTRTQEVYDQLRVLGISLKKVWEPLLNSKFPSMLLARTQYMEYFAKIVYKYGVEGDVAELGVYEAGFAYHINREFPDRKLYLFDTFSGFDERDTSAENVISEGYGTWKVADLTSTLKDCVEQGIKERLIHPQMAVIKRGYFPDTFDLPQNMKFAYVNMDVDMYQPTLAGLRIFWNHLSKGGIITCHDYFDEPCYGVRKAVDEFCAETGLIPLPIGDMCSVSFQKR
jgi:O-methyltransferase